MPDYTPTSDLGIRYLQLREMIARSATFQTVSGTATVDAAKAKINFGNISRGDGFETKIVNQARFFNADEHTSDLISLDLYDNRSVIRAIIMIPPNTTYLDDDWNERLEAADKLRKIHNEVLALSNNNTAAIHDTGKAYNDLNPASFQWDHTDKLKTYTVNSNEFNRAYYAVMTWEMGV